MDSRLLTFVTTCKGRLRHLQETLPHRRTLHAEVHAACRHSADRQAAVRLEIPVADVTVNHRSLTTGLICTIDMRGARAD